jgi:hypothetical protein
MDAQFDELDALLFGLESTSARSVKPVVSAPPSRSTEHANSRPQIRSDPPQQQHVPASFIREVQSHPLAAQLAPSQRVIYKQTPAPLPPAPYAPLGKPSSTSGRQYPPISIGDVGSVYPALVSPKTVLPLASKPTSSTSSRLPVLLDAIVPPEFRSIFPYKSLNTVQSAVMPAVLLGPHNVVVAAPTGCGKTAILELAILRLLMNSTDAKLGGKVVYLAPLKALVAERLRDWSSRFEPIGLRVTQLTGDESSAHGKGHLLAMHVLICELPLP